MKPTTPHPRCTCPLAVVVLLLSLSTAVPMAAQTTGMIEGTVVDVIGNAMPVSR